MLTRADVERATGANGLKVASFFAGAGGSSLGYRLAGFDVIYANEHDRHAAETYALNGSVAPDTRDVRDVLGREIGSPDVVDGSPPCQDFSLLGKRELGGERAMLYYEFVRLIGEVQPRAFCAENVIGFATGKSYSRHFVPILAALRSHGYVVGARTLDGSWLGVPQARKRVVLIGLRDDQGVLPSEVFPRKHERQTVIRDALPDVARIVKRPNEGARANRFKWAEELTWPASGPAPTLLASGLGGASAAEILIETRDGERRPPTVYELKALSGFPIDFEFADLTKAWRVLGNAVPPPMARSWAEGLSRAL